MSDEIARGILAFGVDASEVSAGMAKAEQAVEKFERAAVGSANNVGKAMTDAGAKTETSAGRIEASKQRLIQQIEREAITLEKGRIGWLQHRAAQVGASDAVAPLIARYKAAQGQLGSLDMTVRQTTQAWRMLPAQITDIVTGLISGQPAYLVAIQQGGQLKDSFGGIVPAAKALLSVFTPMRIALGGVAGGAIALAMAYREGSSEADAYNRALVTSGNLAGVTAGKLGEMAKAISDSAGTQGQAAEALAALVSAGVTRNLEQIASVAIDTQKRLGTAVEDTVKQYVELGNEPVKASEKLNQQYRYLTLAVYDNIKALEDQGRAAEAADLAQKTYAESQRQRNEQLANSLGDYESAWEKIGAAAKRAWDYMLNIGRGPSTRQSLEDAEKKLALMSPGGSGFGRYAQAEIDAQKTLVEFLRRRVATEEGLAAVSGQYNQRQQDGIAAQKEVNRLLEEGRTKAQQLADALKEQDRRVAALRATPGADLAKIDEDDQRVRQILRDRYSERKSGGSAGSAFSDDAATRRLQALRETEAVLIAQLSGEERLNAATKERVEFERLIADLKEKRTLTADQKSLLANEDALHAQLVKNEALERELSLRDLINRKLDEQAREEQRFRERHAQIMQEIEVSRESRNQNYSGRLGAFGLGSAKQQEVAGQSGIYVEFQRRQAQLLKSTPERMLGGDEYMTKSMEITEALDQALVDHANYYESLREMQGNWLNGYSQAVQNYIDETNNLAKQTDEIVSNMFEGLEDYLVDFVMAGEMKFRDFAEAILADLVRISVQGLFTGPLAKILAAADGEVLGSSGRVTAFAGGGIVSQPTMFNYSGGTGVMGEAGYEAVMPVARGADGTLGVKVTGGQTGPTIIQHVTVGSGVSYGDVMSAMTVAKESAKREILESMRRGGAFA